MKNSINSMGAIEKERRYAETAGVNNRQDNLTDIKELLYQIANRVYPRWMDLRLASWYSSLSKKTLLRLIMEGHISARKLDGKWIVDRESIDLFMQQDTVEIKSRLALK
jgi:hypothetical protein